MSKVAVWAKIPVAEGKRDELIAALQQAITNAESEEGTLTYILNEDPNDPSTLYFYELYSDNDAFMAHVGSDMFKELGKSLAGLVGGAPDLKIVNVLFGKGA